MTHTSASRRYVVGTADAADMLPHITHRATCGHLGGPLTAPAPMVAGLPSAPLRVLYHGALEHDLAVGLCDVRRMKTA